MLYNGNNDFYPTPAHLARKMLDKVNHFVIIAWLSRKRTVKSEEKIKKLRKTIDKMVR